MELTLDCRKELPQLHEQLAQELCFPEWYGKNLDALHDCLNDIVFPVTITVLFGDLHPKLLRVLYDCTEENPNLTIHIPE